MTGRIKIIRKTTSVVDGRRQQEEKEFFSCWYAVYKGVEFKIYDACPMFTDDRKYQLKCRAGA